MSDQQETTGQEPQVTTNTAEVDQTADTASTEQTATQEVDGQQPETFDREYVEKLRKEAADYRIKSKAHEDAVAAAKADNDSMLQKIGKELGFIKDEESEQADAQKLIESITSERDKNATERDETAKELRALREENALNKAIGTHGADDSLTIAYLRGTGKLADLDPAADDYADQVSQVVQDAVASNPKLAAQAADRRSGVDTTNTNTEQSGLPITPADLEKMTSREVYEAQKAGKLNHLL